MKLTKEEFRQLILDGLKKRKREKRKREKELDRYCAKRTIKYFVDRSKRKK